MTHSGLYTRKEKDYTVQITHWDYLYVDRQSGRAYSNWCRFQVLDGKLKGRFYETAIAHFLSLYAPAEA